MAAQASEAPPQSAAWLLWLVSAVPCVGDTSQIWIDLVHSLAYHLRQYHDQEIEIHKTTLKLPPPCSLSFTHVHLVSPPFKFLGQLYDSHQLSNRTMDHKHGVEAWRAILKARSHGSLAILLCKLRSSYHWWDGLLFDSHMFSPSLPWFVYLARFMMILCFRLTSDRPYKVSVSGLQFRYQKSLWLFQCIHRIQSPYSEVNYNIRWQCHGWLQFVLTSISICITSKLR